MTPRKINYSNPTKFSHHRDGWSVASNRLLELHNPEGVVLFDWADRVFKERKPINHLWCGFLHNVLRYPEEYTAKYTNRIFCLTDLVNQPHFQDSLKHCAGLFTLTKHNANFLQRHLDVPITSLYHPASIGPEFCWESRTKQVIMIGQWLRRFHSIYELQATGFEKVLVQLSNYKDDYEEMKKYVPNPTGVTLVMDLSNAAYDSLLAKSIVFLDLYDVSACNVILECIMRNTPLLIRLLPGAVEYLGVNYPLYFQSVEEASSKIQNQNLLHDAHVYLKIMDKTHFDPKRFTQTFTESKIYQNLPIIKTL